MRFKVGRHVENAADGSRSVVSAVPRSSGLRRQSSNWSSVASSESVQVEAPPPWTAHAARDDAAEDGAERRAEHGVDYGVGQGRDVAEPDQGRHPGGAERLDAATADDRQHVDDEERRPQQHEHRAYDAQHLHSTSRPSLVLFWFRAVD